MLVQLQKLSKRCYRELVQALVREVKFAGTGFKFPVKNNLMKRIDSSLTWTELEVIEKTQNTQGETMEQTA